MPEDVNIKKLIDDALREHEQEKQAAEEKRAAEEKIAADLGFRAYMKEAGIADPEEQEAFIEAAREFIVAVEG